LTEGPEDLPERAAAAWWLPDPKRVRAVVGAVAVLSIAHRIVVVSRGGRLGLASALEPVVTVFAAIVLFTLMARLAERRGWRPVPKLVVPAIVAGLLGVPYMFGVRAAPSDPGDELVTFSPARVTARGFVTGLQLYGLWVLIFRYPELARAVQARRDEARRSRERAELVQLRAHLQPHFLRNTLTSVAALVTQEPNEARHLLAVLADLLTDTLETSAPSHALEAEMTWLRRYALILEARHGDSLAFDWDVAPDAQGTVVPKLLLQPLVENAVLHGALRRGGGGVVRLHAHRDGGRTVVVVEDNGPGIHDDRPRTGEALGLHLVQRRLQIECPGARFDLSSSPAGTRAIVELP
jgi:signal transduction histidine kinase